MKIGILGTGNVGQTLGTKLVSLEHDVKMGSRTAGGDKARSWVANAGGRASEGTFADAIAHGDIIFNCTLGSGALNAVGAAGSDALAGKIVVDVSNPLDFSKGFPPTLFVSNDDSLGEQIQRTYPDAKVVKALNTVAATVMVNPGKIGQPHDLLICGNDRTAKQTVEELLQTFGWERFVDLGDISMSRGTEAYLLLWTRLYKALGTGDFNIHLVRADEN